MRKGVLSKIVILSSAPTTKKSRNFRHLNSSFFSFQPPANARFGLFEWFIQPEWRCVFMCLPAMQCLHMWFSSFLIQKLLQTEKPDWDGFILLSSHRFFWKACLCGALFAGTNHKRKLKSHPRQCLMTWWHVCWIKAQLNFNDVKLSWKSHCLTAPLFLVHLWDFHFVCALSECSFASIHWLQVVFHHSLLPWAWSFRWTKANVARWMQAQRKNFGKSSWILLQPMIWMKHLHQSEKSLADHLLLTMHSHRGQTNFKQCFLSALKSPWRMTNWSEDCSLAQLLTRTGDVRFYQCRRDSAPQSHARVQAPFITRSSATHCQRLLRCSEWVSRFS